MYFLGIGPGQKGCLTIFDEKNNPHMFPFESGNVIDTLKEWQGLLKNNCLCTIEEPHSFGKNKCNPCTLLALGKNYGYLTGVLDCMGIPYYSVIPAVWERYHGLLKQGKESSIALVEQLFPGINLYRTQKCTTKHDGMSDSVLIALYGKQQYEAGNVAL